MSFHLTSLLSAIFITAIMIPFYSYAFQKPGAFLRIEKRLLKAAICLMIFRLLFPVEFPHSISIYISRLYPKIIRSFEDTVLFSNDVITLTWTNLLVYLWACGSIIMLAKMIIRHHGFQKYIEQNGRKLNFSSSGLSDDPGTSISIVQASINGPIAFGFFHPQIIIPNMNYSSKDLCFIILHEMIHLRRKDLWAKLVIELICVFLWWNPIVYICKKHLISLIEIQVDNDIKKALDEKDTVAYMDCLVKVQKQMIISNPPSVSIGIFDGFKSSLLLRVQLMTSPSPRKGRIVMKSLFSLAMVLYLLSFFLIFEPGYIPSRDAEGTFNLFTQDAFLIEQGGGYGLYVNGEFMTEISEVSSGTLANFKIYKSIEEATK